MKLFGIAGHSGMGKTTLLERLVPALTARGLVVSMIKHSHKAIEIDRPEFANSFHLNSFFVSEPVRDAVNEGRDGSEPFRQTCTAWLHYFQRNGISGKEAYANPLSIPVTMVPMRVMVRCEPAAVAPKVRHFRHRHDKRVRID